MSLINGIQINKGINNTFRQIYKPRSCITFNKYNKFHTKTWLKTFSTNRYGIAGIPELKEPKDFDNCSKKAQKHAKLYLSMFDLDNQKLSALPGSYLLQQLDNASNALCRVADLAECVRNAHPEPEWKDSGHKVVESVSKFMAEANLNENIYTQLKAIATTRFNELSDEQALVLSQVVNSMEHDGVHLPIEKRERVMELIQREFEISSILINQPRPDTSEARDSKDFWFLSRFTNTSNEILTEELVKSRLELAKLRGYNSWHDFAVRQTVLKHGAIPFLNRLWVAISDGLLRDMITLSRTKNRLTGEYQIYPWDIAPLAHQIRNAEQPKYLFWQKPSKPEKMSLDTVLGALNKVTSNVLGVELKKGVPLPGEVWHDSVTKLVLTRNNITIGIAYLDLHDRPGKWSGSAQFTLQGSKSLGWVHIDKGYLRVLNNNEQGVMSQKTKKSFIPKIDDTENITSFINNSLDYETQNQSFPPIISNKKPVLKEESLNATTFSRTNKLETTYIKQHPIGNSAVENLESSGIRESDNVSAKIYTNLTNPTNSKSIKMNDLNSEFHIPSDHERKYEPTLKYNNSVESNLSSVNPQYVETLNTRTNFNIQENSTTKLSLDECKSNNCYNESENSKIYYVENTLEKEKPELFESYDSKIYAPKSSLQQPIDISDAILSAQLPTIVDLEKLGSACSEGYTEIFQLPRCALLMSLNDLNELSYSSVSTLAHELGHLFHSLLSHTSLQHMSGTRGEVDFVEFVSHFMQLYISKEEAHGALFSSNPRSLSSVEASPTEKMGIIIGEQKIENISTQEITKLPVKPAFHDWVSKSRILRYLDTATQIILSLFDHYGHSEGDFKTLMTNFSNSPCLTSGLLFTSDGVKLLESGEDYGSFNFKSKQKTCLSKESIPDSIPSLISLLEPPAMGHFEHLVHYSGRYYCYLSSRALALHVWSKGGFSDQPFHHSPELAQLMAHGSTRGTLQTILSLSGDKHLTEVPIESFIESLESSHELVCSEID